MIEVTKMFSHYNFCKIETTFQCLQGFQRVKVDEGVKLRKNVRWRRAGLYDEAAHKFRRR